MNRLMEPIKIKLRYDHLLAVRNYLTYAQWRANNAKAQAHEELIVLAEHQPMIERRCKVLETKDHRKSYPCSFPLSVARILHRRWQHEVISDSLRLVLGGIDLELTNREMKPDTLKYMIV